jgi:hypothetical protein
MPTALYDVKKGGLLVGCFCTKELIGSLVLVHEGMGSLCPRPAAACVLWGMGARGMVKGREEEGAGLLPSGPMYKRTVDMDAR